MNFFKRLICILFCAALLICTPVHAGWFDDVKSWFTPKVAAVIAVSTSVAGFFAWKYWFVKGRSSQKTSQPSGRTQKRTVPAQQQAPAPVQVPMTAARLAMPRLHSPCPHIVPPVPTGGSNWDFPDKPNNIPDLVYLARLPKLAEGFRFNLDKHAIAQHGYTLQEDEYNVTLVRDFPENNVDNRCIRNVSIKCLGNGSAKDLTFFRHKQQDGTFTSWSLLG